ncbi:hypothetical protein GOV04_05535 [Candidatus Woesearchaeota archaeon]|nr:hypothetical protein [Candidatus Woesearchaeota archaeon]
MRTFKVLCPNCGNTMLTTPTTLYLSNNRKKCVYCGSSFKTKNTIVSKML